MVDADGRLLGLLSFADLFRLPANAALEGSCAVCRLRYKRTRIRRRWPLSPCISLNSVPVVDAGRRLLGAADPTHAVFALSAMVMTDCSGR